MSDQTITNAALTETFAQESGEVWLLFVTVEHPALTDGPLYLVRNTVDVTRTVAGQPVTYTGAQFEYVPPEQREENVSVGRIRVPNVHRDIVNGLRLLKNRDPARVTLEWTLASAPDTPQQHPLELDLDQVSYDAEWVEGRLTAGGLNAAYPELNFDNANFPGIYPG